MPEGTIFNIMKYSIHDGPGIRTTVFFKGCPLSCKWCHNPESINPEPQQLFYDNRVDPETGKNGVWETAGYRIAPEKLMEEIRKDVIFYDSSGGGVTFSGGEPLYQHEFLLEMLERCKEEYIHTAVDTSGFCNTDIIRKVAGLARLFLYDVKFASSDKHRQYCGVPNEVILRNLHEINGMAKILIRIPVIPGINDSIEEMTAIAEAIKGVKAEMLHLLPYHNIQSEKYKRLGVEYTLGDVPTGDTADLDGLQKLFQSYGYKTKIGG